METGVTAGPRVTKTTTSSSSPFAGLALPAWQEDAQATTRQKAPSQSTVQVIEPSTTTHAPHEDPKSGILNQVGGFISGILGLFSADPDKRASFGSGIVNLGIDLIPFMGPFKKLVDAHALVHHNNPVLQHEGRTLFVLGAVELLLDTVTLGGSAVLPDELLTYPRLIRDYQRRANQEKDPKAMFPDPVSILIRGFLMIPGASTLIDSLLGKSTDTPLPNGASAA